MDLVSLLVFVIVAGLIYYLITLLPLPPPFKMIVTVIMILIAILWLVGLLPGGHGLVLHR